MWKAIDFCFFARNMDKNIGKNISKNWSRKYSEKLLDHAKQSATDVLKTTLQRAKTNSRPIADATSDLSGFKIVHNTTKISRSLPQNDLKTLTNEHDKQIPK